MNHHFVAVLVEAGGVTAQNHREAVPAQADPPQRPKVVVVQRRGLDRDCAPAVRHLGLRALTDLKPAQRILWVDVGRVDGKHGGIVDGTAGPPAYRSRITDSGRVLTTCWEVAQPPRAVPTDRVMFSSPRSECASVEHTICTPASSASRTCSPLRSRRSGRPLTSSATACSRAMVNTCSKSRAFSGRRLMYRPLGW